MADSILNPPQTPTTPQTPQANPPAPAAIEVPKDAWYAGFTNADVREWVHKLGTKSPEMMAQKAFHQERLLGADKAGRAVIMPKDENDTAAVNEILTRLGRPEKVEDYGIKLPEGVDDSLLKAALPEFHKLGLTKKQAAGIAEWWQAQTGTSMEAAAKEQEQKLAVEVADLKKEWGNEFPKRLEIARRGIQEAGMTPEQAQAIEGAVGPKAAAMLFERLGRPAIEAAVHQGTPEGRTFGMTPGEATERIKSLMTDRDWAKRYINGGASEKDEMNRLQRIAAGL